MRETYSLYEAKAKLSAIIRRVREGDSIVVTVHGEPVAEIRPIPREPTALTERLELLAERGILVRPEADAPGPRAVARRPGALARFLAERDE
ncbi:MAG TPA: type II toxin-antitoxin system prevent-host-death family antitoxin [Gemmatimonadaceae bacterium]|nr:type II toxin-antitoxin system prevent-host-death family antitoxin [Gemmatimonadaceae bacterium]